MTVQSSPADAAPAILDFWFGEVGEQRWFAKDEALDARIRTRFADLRQEVVASRAEAWRDTPQHLLAAIILVDQYSRNIHRGTAQAFAADPLALELALLALDRGWDSRMTPAQRQFLLMPLMHSEELRIQDRGLVEFGRLGDASALDYARRHRELIARFGRFPGRNAALGRRTTPEEQDALDAGAAF